MIEEPKLSKNYIKELIFRFVTYTWVLRKTSGSFIFLLLPQNKFVPKIMSEMKSTAPNYSKKLFQLKVRGDLFNNSGLSKFYEEFSKEPKNFAADFETIKFDERLELKINLLHSPLIEFAIVELSPVFTNFRLIWNKKSSTEDLCLMIYVVSGSVNIIDGAVSTEIRTSHFSLVNPKHQISLLTKTKTKMLFMLIPEDYFFTHVGFSFSSFEKKVFGSKSFYEVAFVRLLQVFINALDKLEPQDCPAICDSLLCAFRPIYRTILDSNLEGQGNRKEILRTKASNYMSTHIGDPELSVKRIAEHLGISSRFLSIIFREIGTTPLKYLYELRLRKASVHLAEEHMYWNSVKEIAEMNGFISQSHFAKLFKERFGMTPHEWRENSKKTSVSNATEAV